MPNQRKKGKRQVCVWLDSKERRALRRLSKNNSAAIKRALREAVKI